MKVLIPFEMNLSKSESGELVLNFISSVDMIFLKISGLNIKESMNCIEIKIKLSDE